MIKSFCICLAITLLYHHADAQFMNFDLPATTFQNKLELNSGANFGSNSIHTGFANKFYTGQFLTDDIKNATLKHIQSSNNLGTCLHNQIAFYHSAKEYPLLMDVTWYIKVGNQVSVDALFAGDIFKIAFMGNAPGEQMSFGNSSFRMLNYNYYSYGLQKSWSKNGNRYMFDGAISLLEGVRYSAADITSGNFYTAPDVSSLTVDYDFKYSHTTARHPFYGLWFAGSGVGTNLNFRMDMKKGLFIKAGINQAGMIKFNKNVQTMSASGKLNFKGIEVNNLLDAKSYAISNGAYDFLIKNFKPKYPNEPLTANLPAIAYLQVGKNFSESKVVFAGIEKSIYRYDHWLLYINAAYRLQCAKNGNTTWLQGRIAYGGYGTYHIGAGIGGLCNKSLVWGIGTNDLQCLVLPNKSNSASASVKLGVLF